MRPRPGCQAAEGSDPGGGIPGGQLPAEQMGQADPRQAGVDVAQETTPRQDAVDECRQAVLIQIGHDRISLRERQPNSFNGKPKVPASKPPTPSACR